MDLIQEEIYLLVFFSKLTWFNYPLNSLTKINCLLVKKLLSNFYKDKIVVKKPNDLLINNMKISGILQETLSKSGANIYYCWDRYKFD